MTWLRRTLDHLFTEPREITDPRRQSGGRHHELAARRKREIEIEARRGVLGF